jgi:hypothetical protein
MLDDGGVWRMWHEGGYLHDYIGYAYSTDGLHWTDSPNNPKLGEGLSGWERGCVCDPSVVKVNGVYYMLYTGAEASFYDLIGLATFTDSDGTYTKSQYNPVLGHGNPSDDYWCARPSLIYEEGKFKVWYDGRSQANGPPNNSGPWSGIYYAESTDAIHWTRKGLALAGNYAEVSVKRLDNTRFIMTVQELTGPAPDYPTRYTNVFIGTSEQNFVLVARGIDVFQTWNPNTGVFPSGFWISPDIVQISSTGWRIYYGGVMGGGREWAIACADYYSASPTTGTLRVFASYQGSYIATPVTITGLESKSGTTTTDSSNPLTFELTAGAYTVSGNYAGTTQTTSVTVVVGQTTDATLNFGGSPPPPPKSIWDQIVEFINQILKQAHVDSRLLFLGAVAVFGVALWYGNKRLSKRAKKH